MRGVLSAVENGYGIGWVSSMALRQRDTRIAFVRLAGINLRRSLYLVTERRRILPLPASAFLNWFWQSESTRKAIETNIPIY